MIPKRVRVNMIYQLESVNPLVQRIKPLRKNVGPHALSATLKQIDPLLLKSFVKPMRLNAVSPPHVPGGRALAGLANLDHRRVVLVKETNRVTLQNCVPKG